MSIDSATSNNDGNPLTKEHLETAKSSTGHTHRSGLHTRPPLWAAYTPTAVGCIPAHRCGLHTRPPLWAVYTRQTTTAVGCVHAHRCGLRTRGRLLPGTPAAVGCVHAADYYRARPPLWAVYTPTAVGCVHAHRCGLRTRPPLWAVYTPTAVGCIHTADYFTSMCPHTPCRSPMTDRTLYAVCRMWN